MPILVVFVSPFREPLKIHRGVIKCTGHTGDIVRNHTKKEAEGTVYCTSPENSCSNFSYSVQISFIDGNVGQLLLNKYLFKRVSPRNYLLLQLNS